MTTENSDMPNQTFEPGLWSFVLAAVTGAAGWIRPEAVDAMWQQAMEA